MEFRELVFLGHASVMLKSPEFVVAIDPWLLHNPVTPENLRTPERIDGILLTHGHLDHAGDVLRLADHYKCPVAGNVELIDALVDDGMDHKLGIRMNKGGTAKLGPCKVALTQAFHSNSYTGRKGTIYTGEACGAIVKDDKRAFYHAGDTCAFGDMALIKKFHAPEYAFFPIGDNYTMGPSEAVYAAELVGAKYNVPIHYKSFPGLVQDATPFVIGVTAAGLTPVVMEPGQAIELA